MTSHTVLSILQSIAQASLGVKIQGRVMGNIMDMYTHYMIEQKHLMSNYLLKYFNVVEFQQQYGVNHKKGKLGLSCSIKIFHLTFNRVICQKENETET